MGRLRAGMSIHARLVVPVAAMLAVHAVLSMATPCLCWRRP